MNFIFGFLYYVGVYTETGWQYSGYMYYSDPAKHWRFDEVFEYDAKLHEKYPSMTDEITEFDFANETTVLSYHMSPTTFDWSCDIVPVPSWWAPDYLYSDTTYLGIKMINNILCDVYSTDNIWPGSTIESYISRNDGSFIRLLFDQPSNDFYLDVINMTTVESIDSSTWNIPETIQTAAPECS
mmetsp:Transcript_20742/g.24535  ORF Transcript_20742/g.24535 Transcript_20742/m.24535 type:complete len:183 (+) Transcript_20742:216-764(+)